MKRNKQKTLRNKCDAAWARITKKIIFAKYGVRCLWCGDSRRQFQSDHIVNRWKTATRWNLSNCIVLCAPCHLFRKKREPIEWAQTVLNFVPEEVVLDLRKQSEEIVKPDYQKILDGLIEFEIAFDKEYENEPRRPA